MSAVIACPHGGGARSGRSSDLAATAPDPGGTADDPFGDGEVDGPAGGLGEVTLELAGAEQGAADPYGERLCAGGEGDRVGADHPGPVGGNIPAADGGEAEDQAGDQRAPEHEPEDVQQVARTRLRGIQQGHPECRGRDEQAGDDQNPAGAAVPGPVPAPELRHELEGPEENVGGGAEDVQRDGQREAGEPLLGRDQLGATGELKKPQRPDDQRDGAERDQGGRDRPAQSRSLLSRPILRSHRTATTRSWAGVLAGASASMTVCPGWCAGQLPRRRARAGPGRDGRAGTRRACRRGR